MLSGSIRQDDLPNSETKGYFPLTVANKKKTLKTTLYQYNVTIHWYSIKAVFKYILNT